MTEFPEKVRALLKREGTAISWADLTMNFWIGCQEVSPACDLCYARELTNNRLNTSRAAVGLPRIEWGPGGARQLTAEANRKKPLRWQRVAAEAGVTLTVFCSSLSDWADNAVPDEWRAEIAQTILATPNLRWMMLTKRVGNARRMLETMFPGGVPDNLCLGITVANQAEADRDIPRALSVKGGLRIKRLFLSIEPMLGPVDLSEWLKLPDAIDLVIVGGESGKGARPIHPDWPWIVQVDCEEAGVAFHFKQWGEWKPWAPGDPGRVRHVSMRDGATGSEPGRIDGERNLRSDTQPVARVGTARAGRTLRGKEYLETMPC